MKLMVIDGNSLINRAFYGIRMLTTKDGQPTNAVYGFVNILLKLLDEEKPDALCVTFDRKAPTFRHLAYEGYKAQRKGMPDELAAQLPVLKDVLAAMNIPRYELDGWEADDLIGTIAARDTAAGWETVIVTGDKDSLQLVSDATRVKLVSTRMGQTTTKEMTPETFREAYGFDPVHIVDLKALMGDTSDNIPGVKGIGEKTAMDLIQRYQSVEAIYADVEGVEAKPAVKKKLAEGEEQARMSYDLATIRCDAPIDFSPEDARRREPDGPALYELFLALEFNKLIDKMGLSGGPAAGRADKPAAGAVRQERVTDRVRMEELVEQWRREPWVAVLALPSLDVVAVAWDGGARAALCAADRLEGYNELLRALFSGEIQKVSHNVKDLMHLLLDEGLSTDGFCFDTALAAYLLSPTDGSYELEKLGITYFNQEFPKAKEYLAPDAFGPLADPAGPAEAMCAHAALAAALYRALAPKLEELDMHELYYGLELPLCPVLAEMERAGMLVDRRALADFGILLDGRIQADEALIYELAGEEFNINSTQQFGRILFDKLGLPPVKKTKTGYSTNADVLEKLRDKHPIVEAVLDYRQLAKLKSTYVDGLTKVIAADGRIHTSFQNTVTATGRLSSTEPNLQNIPVRTELGAELRKMFVAPAGRVLVDADYSQIELRLLAHIAGDEHMIAAFRAGEDIHTVTASQVFGVPPEQVTHEMRRRAKAVNFGIVYGISDFSLSQDIGVTRAEAKAYMEKYFEKYSGVHAYMTQVVERAKADGYVSTLMGRRRWLPELKSSNFNLRSFGERVALNMPIQGTAADLIKKAMLHVDGRLRREGLEARLVLQVHDELIVECPEGEAEQVQRLLAEEMEHVAELAVPLTAEAHAGKSWAEAKG
ncbi:DNA polymerase I [Flavonifractor plautii]|jgi:DNA polymerase-1|uniref:DNA polymerase I n=1 Tax=Flavonifractor plautii TaxID=292800 RepID=UPI0010493889|nr:DNA polymerase I [Flavonifractor plautii]MDR3861827.1 DNA polymerase I [Flavonifractor sp.]MCB5780552.1 DNA polymerase I [Flavonifractor plautii]MCQ5311095.1 DNA polymerase I [Flavonifractor plautii]MCR1908526.1 DNA polymerase I [Flavonifractor plautii]TCO89807.1 DNA polymerase I [Flavonifractor plautii DSM 6740]